MAVVTLLLFQRNHRIAILMPAIRAVIIMAVLRLERPLMAIGITAPDKGLTQMTTVSRFVVIVM